MSGPTVLARDARRISAVQWGLTGLILLALIPESLPLDLLRVLARYLLIAFVPGLTVWIWLRVKESSVVDILVYPSLLSVLPFGAVAFGAVMLGLDLRLAGWLTVALFSAIAFSPSRRPFLSATNSDWLAIAVAIAVAAVLLVIPFGANSFQAVAWDAPVHAAIVSRILVGVVPPDSPIMAGQPANYYWAYHFYAAVVMRLTGLSIYQVFAVLNVHALIIFALAGYGIARRLTHSLFGRMAAVWALIFGLNAFGFVNFFLQEPESADRWYSLLAPFKLVHGYLPSLGSLIHEFLDGSPFVMSFPFDVAWLDVAVRRADNERGSLLAVGILILTTAFYLHSLTTAFLAAASVIAAALLVLIERNTIPRERVRFGLDVVGIIVVALIATAPYAWNLLHSKTGLPLFVEFNFHSLLHAAWTMVACAGLVAVLALPSFRPSIWEKKRSVALLSLVGAIIAGTALTIHAVREAEYKLTYLLIFSLAPLVAVAWDVWRRWNAMRLAFCLALLLCVPTNTITSYCFVVHPPRETRPETRQNVLRWIRDKTPANAIFLENQYWKQYQTSEATSLYFERYSLDIAVYAQRRYLFGSSESVMAQWGYRDIAVREQLAEKLTNGLRLDSLDMAYLASLKAPVIVLTKSYLTVPDAFPSATYRPIYRDGDVCLYSVVSLNSDAN